ncbi:hypothetical protein K1719_034223 [Acacia pycnantha]|nr:hypothetical protein K1719_034223 [Acacia pycnantha]
MCGIFRSLRLATDGYCGGGGSRGDHCNFTCVSMAERKVGKQFMPTLAQLLKHPLAVGALVPKDVSLFFAGAIAGTSAKTTHGVRAGQESAKKAIGFIEAITVIAKEEGIKGYWKGNLPQVIRIIPYSAVQLLHMKPIR